MKRAFILTLDTAGDTDFTSLADDIASAVSEKGMNVLDCKVFVPVQPKESTLPTLPMPKPPMLQPPPIPPVSFNLPPS